MFNWASTLTQSGANYPFSLPLKTDKLDTGFNVRPHAGWIYRHDVHSSYAQCTCIQQCGARQTSPMFIRCLQCMVVGGLPAARMQRRCACVHTAYAICHVMHVVQVPAGVGAACHLCVQLADAHAHRPMHVVFTHSVVTPHPPWLPLCHPPCPTPTLPDLPLACLQCTLPPTARFFPINPSKHKLYKL